MINFTNLFTGMILIFGGLFVMGIGGGIIGAAMIIVGIAIGIRPKG